MLGDAPCRSQNNMKDILMMKKTHNSLLPLRGKISPPTILNCLNHSTEQKNYKSRETTKPVGGRERLFSASTMSAYSSKHGSTISDRDLTSPFTPPANGDRAFLFRRPSEHFLEVLEEHKQRPTVPKVRSSSCLPPLGKMTQGEDSQKRNLRGTKIAFSGYLNGDDVESRQVDSNGGRLLVSEQRSDPTAVNIANKKILRKSQSLPLIKPCTAFTAGTDCVNVSVSGSHTATDILNEEQKLNTCADRVDNAPIKEYLEEMCDESDPLEHNDEEETLEKFSMICDWLKECEKAKVV